MKQSLQVLKRQFRFLRKNYSYWMEQYELKSPVESFHLFLSCWILEEDFILPSWFGHEFVSSYKGRKMNPTVLFNPKEPRDRSLACPNSILSVAASIDDSYSWALWMVIFEEDPWPKLSAYLKTGSIRFLPVRSCQLQLRQAIPLTKKNPRPP